MPPEIKCAWAMVMVFHKQATGLPIVSSRTCIFRSGDVNFMTTRILTKLKKFKAFKTFEGFKDFEDFKAFEDFKTFEGFKDFESFKDSEGFRDFEDLRVLRILRILRLVRILRVRNKERFPIILPIQGTKLVSSGQIRVLNFVQRGPSYNQFPNSPISQFYLFKIYHNVH